MFIHYLWNEFPHNDKVKQYNEDIKHFAEYDLDTADIIVCGGGDGTLLKTINKYRHLNKVFWGVNAGTVGFLMNDGFPTDYNDIKTKKFTLIKVKVTYLKEVRDLGSIYDKEIEVTETFQAFNEVALGGDMNSWIDFSVTEKDDLFGDFKGGGVIISTTQGSTGINKNNGGTVLPLSSKLWSITGDKTDRDISYVINPRKTIISVSSRTPVTLWVDGSNHIIKNVKNIEVSKGDAVFLMFGNFKDFASKRRL